MPKWRSTLCLEGVNTSDRRRLAPLAMSWRQVPLTLMGQTQLAAGHDGAHVVGRIDDIHREGLRITGTGEFAPTLKGEEMARLVEGRYVTGVSIDAAAHSYAIEEDDDGELTLVITRGEIMGATVCAYPAFADAGIEIDDSLVASGAVEVPFRFTMLAEVEFVPEGDDALTASGAPGEIDLNDPPRDWFSQPELSELTPIQITDDGRIFGHWASRTDCHTGFKNVCRKIPTGCDYDGEFHLREPYGNGLRTGFLSYAMDHNDEITDVSALRKLYSDTSKVCGMIRVGEDGRGLWMAGAVAPWITPTQLTQMRTACSGSGHWNPIGGNLELIAVLLVPVAGFDGPPKARAKYANGEIVSVVAAGAFAPGGETNDSVEQLEENHSEGDHLSEGLAAQAEILLSELTASH